MNEFDCAQGRRQWHGEDPGLCSSSRRNESQQPVPLLTNGKQVRKLLIYPFVLSIAFLTKRGVLFSVSGTW